MSQLIFMNTMDELTNPNDRKKYGGIVNRSRPLSCSQDIALCLRAPTKRYTNYHDRLQEKGSSHAHYIPIPPNKGYDKNEKLIHELQEVLRKYPVSKNTICSFNVTESLKNLADQLGLILEADFQSTTQGNDKRNLLHILKKILPTYIMDGKVISLKEGKSNFEKVIKEHMTNTTNTVRCKFPQSISGSGVFSLDGSDNQGITDFRNQKFSVGPTGPGHKDGEIIIQQHIPHIVGFYNVMTQTDSLGKSTILGAGITKQKLNGNAHIGNTTDLSIYIEGMMTTLPQEQQQEIKEIALRVSEIYFKKLGSTGLSGIDFAVSYHQGAFKVRIMEVNDRMNGCYPLHHMVEQSIITNAGGLILETVSLPIEGYTQTEEQKLFPKHSLYDKNQLTQQPSYIPLSNSGKQYQALKISHI